MLVKLYRTLIATWSWNAVHQHKHRVHTLIQRAALLFLPSEFIAKLQHEHIYLKKARHSILHYITGDGALCSVYVYGSFETNK